MITFHEISQTDIIIEVSAAGRPVGSIIPTAGGRFVYRPSGTNGLEDSKSFATLNGIKKAIENGGVEAEFTLVCVGINGSTTKAVTGVGNLIPAVRAELAHPATVTVTVFINGRPHSVHSDWSNWPKGG